MGVNLKSIIIAKEIELTDLSGKKIAIDAFNTLYQFLAIIRDRLTGEPLKDSKGRVTSHLSGLLYRTTNMLEAGIKPVFVFDGEPPEFKKKTVEARQAIREEAKKRWEEAVEKGEEAMRYAQAATKLSDEMIDGAKKLLDAMGVPWIQAPSEGEAQCSLMCNRGEVWATGSQDYDSLLLGSPRLVRNLSVTGKRKIPKKNIYIEVKPELIELKEVLKNLGITREQLVVVGVLIGTDYAEGVEKVGPKTALKLVKEHKTLKKVLENVEWKADVDAETIYEFFLKPPTTTNYKMEWMEPNAEKLTAFMVDEHDFSLERVQKVVEKLQQTFTSGKQKNLQSWFKK